MGLFERFPYTNFHELNAEWLLKKMKELEEAMATFKATESLKFADPIIWDITTQYQKSTIVLDPTGNAYLSVQPVPAGVQLNNDEYWLEIFNFTEYTRTANQNLTVHVETNTTRATAAYAVDDWLIWNDVLYRVTAAIAIDDALVIGSNIVHFTVEDFCKAWITYANGLIQQYKNDIDASELAYRNQLAQDIANTTASLQAQLDAAIAGVSVDSELINIRVGYNGITKSTAGDSVRDQVTFLKTMADDISRGWVNTTALSDFQIGDISASGTIVSGNTFLLNTTLIGGFSAPCKFAIKNNGARVKFATFNSSQVFESLSDYWGYHPTSMFTLPAGKYVRLAITDTTYTATGKEYVLENSVTIKSDILNLIESNNTSLTSRTTALETEVTDIRTGYNGITKANAGTSVRDQVEFVKLSVDDSDIGLQNLTAFTPFQIGDLDDNDGSIGAGSGQLISTNLIKFDRPVKFYIRDGFGYNVKFAVFDSNQQFEETTSYWVYHPTSMFTLPAGKYVRVAITDSTYTATGKEYQFENAVRVISDIGAGILPAMKLKKWYCLGDSLTEVNSAATKRYYDYVHEWTGIQFTVDGIGGSGYARRHEYNEAFYNRIADIPNNTSVVTIFGSLNDGDAGMSLGNADDSGFTTVAGYINNTLESFVNDHPLMPIGIIAPTPWLGQSATSNNAFGRQYTELLHEICMRRGLPFLDLFYASGLNPENTQQRLAQYSRDPVYGQHPSEYGHQMIAPKFNEFLKKLLD